MWHHAQYVKLGWERKRGSWERWCLLSQVTIMCDGALLSWECLSTCLAVASGEWIVLLYLLLNCLYLDPWSLFILPLWFFSPILLRGREYLCGAQLLAGAKPWQELMTSEDFFQPYIICEFEDLGRLRTINTGTHWTEQKPSTVGFPAGFWYSIYM